jgi:hypothetical protein
MNVGRDVAIDRIAVDAGASAGAEFVRDAGHAPDRRDVLDVLNLDREAGGPHVVDPSAAAAAPG